MAKVPDGLSIRKIVRHVYNAHNSLFDTVDLEEVKRSVTMYLTAKSKMPSSFIEKTDQRGVYRLKPNYRSNMELQFEFKDCTKEPDEECAGIESIDTSLDMFEGMY